MTYLGDAAVVRRPLVRLSVADVVEELCVRRRGKHGVHLPLGRQLRVAEPTPALALGAAGRHAGPGPKLAPRGRVDDAVQDARARGHLAGLLESAPGEVPEDEKWP